jgi:hypothetical protein
MQPAVSHTDLVVALGVQFEICRQTVKVEVYASPTDFFVRFLSSFNCKRIVHTSLVFE